MKPRRSGSPGIHSGEWVISRLVWLLSRFRRAMAPGSFRDPAPMRLLPCPIPRSCPAGSDRPARRTTRSSVCRTPCPRHSTTPIPPGRSRPRPCPPAAAGGLVTPGPVPLSQTTTILAGCRNDPGAKSRLKRPKGHASRANDPLPGLKPRGFRIGGVSRTAGLRDRRPSRRVARSVQRRSSP